MAPLQFLFFFFLWVTANAGSSSKPIVSFDPNWATVFTKESVTLTCNVDPPETRDQIYYWYRDNQIIPLYLGAKSVKIDYVKQEDGGSYQCQTVTSVKSEPVTLQVAHSWLTLKVPAFVFEGDELYVSCAGYPGYSARDAVLYKDNEVIGSSPSDADFLVGRANMATSGLYRCTRQVKDGVIYYNYASEEQIAVKELFSKPVMKVNPNHLTEGDHMTITCDTKLSPRRETTELQFVFYRNGHNVQGFSLDNTFQVPSVLLENGGNYTCEVTTINDTVRKRSNEISVQVEELFSKPVIKVNRNHLTEADHMTITCDTKLSPRRATTELQFVFYRNGHKVQGFSLDNTFQVPSVLLENGGNYTCEVRTINDTVRKRSDEINVQVAVAEFQSTVTSLQDYKEEEREVGQLPVVHPAERSTIGVEITMALLMSFLTVGLLVFVFKSKVALSFFNRHSYPTNSASVESSGNKKDMSYKYIDV
uniref:Type I TM-receptor XFL1.2b n=1 Tax=Xenopus laevis TaxID=8355 RepID=Q4VWU7_XENLA|nr:Fc receptor-like 3 S homeolog precursor [Xenopus laevis]AAQ56583.1 type I TM-receptor XFL1.2b [Xenopus laevis]